MTKRLVILSGSGISAESGLQTFRDNDGLWNNYSVYEVATPEAWKANPKLVLDFYNYRRRELEKAQPNPGHEALVKLEEHFETTIITQNVDNLHERAGSSNIVHLHGELTKARGEHDEHSVRDIGYTDIKLGDLSEQGDQMRPHIVWFGEDVPLITHAAEICSWADVMIIVGTSLQVYPAAGLVELAPLHCEIYLVDPKANEMQVSNRVNLIKEKAGIAIPALVNKLCSSL